MTSSQRIVLAISFCTLMFVGAWIDTLNMHAFTAGLNLSIQHLTSHLQTSPVLGGLNHLGGNFVFALCLGLMMLDLARRKEWRVMIYCAVTIVVIVGITHVFKELTYSPRPEPFSSEHDSFPSGHTMRATLWCGFIILLNQVKIYRLPQYTPLLFIAIPLWIGFGRLALGRHWFDDVMASYSLVIGALLLLFLLIKHLKNPAKQSCA
jgi:membrane-associated phospholipid phosphatase